jgi:hypothetical protein
LVSEPDRGIYDAWNKWCARIRGDWVLFIGAGDELTQSGTIEHCAAYRTSAARTRERIRSTRRQDHPNSMRRADAAQHGARNGQRDQ